MADYIIMLIGCYGFIVLQQQVKAIFINKKFVFICSAALQHTFAGSIFVAVQLMKDNVSGEAGSFFIGLATVFF